MAFTSATRNVGVGSGAFARGGGANRTVLSFLVDELIVNNILEGYSAAVVGRLLWVEVEAAIEAEIHVVPPGS